VGVRECEEEEGEAEAAAAAAKRAYKTNPPFNES